MTLFLLLGFGGLSNLGFAEGDVGAFAAEGKGAEVGKTGAVA